MAHGDGLLHFRAAQIEIAVLQADALVDLVGARVDARQTILAIRLRRHDDDGDEARRGLLLELAAHVEAVALRRDEIKLCRAPNGSRYRLKSLLAGEVEGTTLT